LAWLGPRYFRPARLPCPAISDTILLKVAKWGLAHIPLIFCFDISYANLNHKFPIKILK
jgi:hypothetical protein